MLSAISFMVAFSLNSQTVKKIVKINKKPKKTIDFRSEKG